MDIQDTNKSEYQEQGPKKGIVIIVITILLGTNGLLLWQFFEKKNSLDLANEKVVTTTAERDALQAQLDQVNAEFEKVKSENLGLQTELSQKDEEIKAKVAEVQRLISLGGPAQIARAKAELAKLKEMNQVFIAQIDSTNAVNARLQQENASLTDNLNQARSQNENLSAENTRLSTKVAAGSILKVQNPVTQGLRYKSNGKVILTNKAKQVQQIRTTFVIAENHVIDHGSINLYLRVLAPGGSVMSSLDDTFLSDGKPMKYTVVQSVDYTNSDTPVTIMWAKGTQFVPGTYNIEIYHNGVLIGRSRIDLK
ncbi:MAG: hypothetical protein IT242_11315 [Bacteroidia bacterium]|nr:hypothetical protein [Bacteroidia bacterium]